MILMAAILGFSCAPVFSPALAPTLDPLSMSTAIALTAGAASVQTAAVAQPEVQATPILASGPTLDPNAMGTSIALTVEAAATQTAAMIPATLTPSVTSIPTETASITPSPTATFYLVIPKTSTPLKIDIPKATATKKKKGGGGGGDDGGGGGGGGGRGEKKVYGCSVKSVMPVNNIVIPPNTLFTAYWTVKNTDSNWDAHSVDLVPAGGNITYLVEGIDLVNTISGGTTLVLPGVPLLSPGIPGTYNTHWQLRRGSIGFCDMYLTIIVQ
jgi:hypothetical protein